MIESGAGNDAIQVLFLFSFPTGKGGGQVTPDSLPTSLAWDFQGVSVFFFLSPSLFHSLGTEKVQPFTIRVKWANSRMGSRGTDPPHGLGGQG